MHRSRSRGSTGPTHKEACALFFGSVSKRSEQPRLHLAPPERRVGCKMSDPYLETIQEQWTNILKLYEAFKKHNPIMLYDIQEHKVYAYPYKEFRIELSVRSQASLKAQYESASAQ